jgi:hypothetical protein
MLGHNDPNWHSNVDTVEFCDSTELKRVIAIALSISYVFSIFDKALIKKFWPVVRQGLFKRIGTLVKLLEELSIAINSSENTEKTEFRIDLFLLGKDLIKASFLYEIELLERIKLIENSSETLQLIEMAKKEIGELENSQNLKWNEKFDFNEEECKKEEQIFNNIYELTYTGPLYARNLFKLVKYQEFENFIAELQYELLGPINELFNLLGKGYNILTISAFLSLEYETIIQPKKIQTLVNLLEKEQLIKKK